MTDTRFQQRWWNLVSASSLSVSEIKALFASPYEKGSFIERTMCNISKIEPNNALMIIFMQKKKCKLKYAKQWLNLFAYYYNREIIS